MQIALVDDASGLEWQSPPLEALVHECRDQGIEIYLFDTNLGLAGNWNRCLNLSRGHFIHLLHQDDRVLPAFYDAISAGLQADAKAGAAFTQQAFITGAGDLFRFGHLKGDTAGTVDDWLEYVFANLAIQCSAMVVRRAVYERLGGFDTNYRYCCDREMWQRIAMEYPVWFDPRPLTDFRVHRGGVSSVLRRRSHSWLELKRCAMQAARRLSPPARYQALRSFRRHTVRLAAVEARRAMLYGDWRGAFAIFKGAASIAQLRDVYALIRHRYDHAPSSRAPDRPFDYAAQRNPRILLLSEFFPGDPVRSVWGAFQRLGRHFLALDRLGPIDAVFFWPEHGKLSQSDVASFSALAKQIWPLRGSINFVSAGDATSLFGRVKEVFWALQGVVGFSGDEPTMRTCGHQQISSLQNILRLCQPDLIFAYRLSTAAPFLRMKSELPPIVVDFPDLENVRLERLAMSKRDLGGIWKARFGALLARRAQRRVGAIASAVLVCSEVEQRKVQSMYPGARVINIPNTAGVLTDLPPASQPVAIFVGTAWYPPNCEAILWLANEIWPHVRRAVPEARLIVVGDKTETLGISSAQRGIETLGFVADLAPIYAAAMIAVCPVRRGSGTRIKIIEASINGRPVVSTTVGAEGLLFAAGTEILIEDDAGGFADACIRLFRDPERAALIGKAALQRARSTYLEVRINERLHAVCIEALHDNRIAAPGPIGESSSMAVIETGERA
jgi:glycosyltransferase involved in cell wall biosynthesis